jgi:hypothetical protein
MWKAQAFYHLFITMRHACRTVLSRFNSSRLNKSSEDNVTLKHRAFFDDGR